MKYVRRRKSVEPLRNASRRHGTLDERLGRHIISMDDCWITDLAVNPSNGYCWISPGPGRSDIGAHVAAWMLANDSEIRDGWHVHHKCANKLCVNPDHLQTLSAEAHRALHAELHVGAP